MEIELNGAPHRLADGQNLQQLVAALELSGKAIAVAVNRQVVPSHLWGLHALQAQDKVDIVRAIGGG
ncbi:sulfur carrier protein ThiS [Paraherbaspirillum soli]|uniref:Sulfur carrier protein ThiS n=1 Tax=Paraherbaspirillum soli TaxID=631222 RepID=A0ABW0MGK2_9BURK